MVQKKTKIKENDENGVQKVGKRRNTTEIDHWAFLEEIEAPMWADLTLEPMLMAEDYDDAWFHTNHLFHQRSARQLRSAFSHSDVGNDFLNINLQGVVSPKLPSSVSKSRGKDYSRNWVRNGGVSLNKSHPVNDLDCRISTMDKGSSEESKPKVSGRSHSGASGSITSLLGNNSYAATLSDSSRGMVDDASTRGVSDSQSVTSTITAESGQQQPLKVLEVSKEAWGQTNGLLNALQSKLRKSCATRPALRVEVSDDRESKGRKSSCGKSSVGSSNLGIDDTKSKAPAVVRKPDFQRQVKAELNVHKESKGSKSSSGKSSVGSSSVGSDIRSKVPSALQKPNHQRQVKAQTHVNRDSKGSKSSSGKSSVGSSNIGCDIKSKALVIVQKPDLQRQVKAETTVHRELKGCKSSSGKSSDDSPNPILQVRKKAAALRQNTDRNLKGRDVMKLEQPFKGKVKVSNMAKASLRTGNAFSSRIDGRDTSAACTSLKAPKSKVLIQTIQKKSSTQPRGKPQGVKGKVGSSSQSSGLTCSGKENMIGRVIRAERTNVKGTLPVARVSDQKKPKLKLEYKIDSTIPVGSKVTTGRGHDGKSTSDVRVYFR